MPLSYSAAGSRGQIQGCLILSRGPGSLCNETNGWKYPWWFYVIRASLLGMLEDSTRGKWHPGLSLLFGPGSTARHSLFSCCRVFFHLFCVWKPFLTLLPVLIPRLSGTSLSCLWNVLDGSAHLGHYLLSSFSTCARRSFAHIFHMCLQQTCFRNQAGKNFIGGG